MKNNKGFTLIELLAVVAILITVVAILTPKIFKQFKTAENITNQEQINSLINTAKIYMNQNSNLLPEENNIYIISLNELKHSGLIQTKEILNPSTKEELTGCIIVKYENNKYKYEYKEENDCNNVITVTFDPQGGQLDQTTKQVIPNDTYGNLPTPTREGYTFMGWNGKNMFDESKYASLNSYNISTTYKWAKIYLNPNTEYYINIIRQNGFDGKNNGHLIINSEPSPSHNWTAVAHESYPNMKLQPSYTTGEEGILYIGYLDSTTNQTNLDVIWANTDVQIEEGSTATPYEPYYITPTTPVVQDKNHTLKAIWKANE